MLTKRIIACLDVNAGRVVKGVQFSDLRDAGDPAALALTHGRAGADEVVLLDISATYEQRSTLLDVVRRTARQLFIPFTVGGGIRSLHDAAAVFDAGADKVAVNSAALADPTLIGRIAHRYGSQAVIVAMDALRVSHSNGLSFGVRATGGRDATGRDAVEWAGEAEGRHACPARRAIAASVAPTQPQLSSVASTSAATRRNSSAAALSLAPGFNSNVTAALRSRRRSQRCSEMGGATRVPAASLVSRSTKRRGGMPVTVLPLPVRERKQAKPESPAKPAESKPREKQPVPA